MSSDTRAASARSAVAIGAYVEVLGRAVEQAWAKRQNNEEFFPEVAARALAETPVPPDADAVGVLEYLTSRHRLVPQEDYGFGDPPVTLYRARDFYVSALYWLDGTTTIHQHMFSGAFRVLEGSSLHVRYGFSRRETINGRMLVGDLRLAEPELLQRGDTRSIVAGDAFIHALFHLDRPSVTLVVRTNRQATGSPQFEYLRPGFAFDPFFRDETLGRQLSGLTTLHQFAPDEALRCAHDMISTTSDILAGFFVVKHWLKLDRSERFDDLVESLIRRHGTSLDVLQPAFAEKKRQYDIILRRRLLQDATHRLFLALLLNLPDRASIDAILRRLFPGADPVDILSGWVEDLSSPALRGISGLRLSQDDLRVVRASLQADEPDASVTALESLGSRVASTPLLEALLT